MIDSALVFVSDLHLGPSFHEETDTLPLDWANWLRLAGTRADLDRFFKTHCVAHNKSIVRALPKYLRRLVVGMQRRGVYQRETFDQCVALGDLVTWPNPDAFNFFVNYMTSDRWKESQSSALIPGLDFRSDAGHQKLTAIPGNHDKLLRKSLAMYDADVTQPLALEPINPQSATVIRRSVGSRQFTFLAVDASTYTTDPDLRVNRSARFHLAGGSVSASLLEQVRSAAAQIANEDAVRVLLIHYPVDFATASGLNGTAQNLVLKHDVDNIGSLLAAIPSGAIHFAAHGHLHRPGFYSCSGFPVLSLGTTFQLGSPVNDFYLVTMSDAGQLRAEHHVWDVTGFKPDPALSGRLN